MFLIPEELSSAIYEYQLDQITESNDDIVQLAIDAAIEEMKSYLNPSAQIRWKDGRPRYDIAAIFSAEGTNRNKLILELCKSIAIYYICRLSNVDIIHERIKERYDRAIDWLEKVSGVGKYADGPSLSPDLPLLTIDPESEQASPFRFGSREKFNHEF